MTKTFLLCSALALMAIQCSLAAFVLFGVKVDLVPVMVLFAALSSSWQRALLAAVFSALLLDALSSAPLGLSIPPAAVASVVINHFRTILYRDNWLLQCLLAAGVSLSCSLWTWLMLVLGATPLPLSFGVIAKMGLIALLAVAVTPPLLWLLYRLGRRLGQESVEVDTF